MLEALDFATLYTCFFLLVLVATVTMSTVWRSNPEEKAAAYWTASFGFGAVGVLLLALLERLGEEAAIAETVFVFLTFMLFWGGFRAFNKKSTPTWSFFLVPALYLVSCYFWPVIYLDANLKLAIESTLIVLVSFNNAYETLSGPANLQLSMSRPISCVLVVHGLFRLGMIYMAFAVPSAIVDGRMTAGWWKILVLEIFVNSSFMAIMTIILLKDRTEQQHRIASETDVLTGIANRRAFVDQCDSLLERDDPAQVLAVLDLDHFKSVNDSFGHNAGDEVLSDFAKVVTRHLPADALFGRMGGEEFAIFLPSGHHQVRGFLEAIRADVEVAGFEHKGTPIPITISIGFVTVKQAGNEFNLLFTAADSALYAAKQNGRNCVRKFSLSQLLDNVEHVQTAKAFRPGYRAVPATDPLKREAS
ncbi:GGDEF domain-containing protein [uncultured Cohaesibacter sp.]|uniref:GGDEF domain-containing protein n=1 Tax=uncultured Cohaesibacter sp. TaxID=1002546 RepID=UPI0029C77F30|nr:GGDEF domain-containing protein [uncultured Cohaesibacter sp.]